MRSNHRPTATSSVTGLVHITALIGAEALLLCVLQMESVFAGLDQMSEDDKLQQLLKLKLRYFSPREVANLMGFPQSFCE